MKVVALAGGVGAGKFLRGLVRVVDPGDVTVVVNTGDDMTLHGLHISPDVDSVIYWLAGIGDRERGWGRGGETFRTVEEVRRLGGQAWFGLGDLDLATHLVRTELLQEGKSLTEAIAHLARAFGVEATLLPMSDDPVTTMIHAVDEGGEGLYMHFQVYWVERGARDEVKGIRYQEAESAAPAPGIVEAISEADAILFCPSNPVVSIAPILAVPPIAEAVRARRERAAGVSPIVAGAPLRGMADRLMPAVGLEVSAHGAATAYQGLLAGWVIDERDRDLAPRIGSDLGVRVAVTDTIMTDDEAAERLARTALDLVIG
jgi:LPPG:FO 2-phospho-L-lactate transferase